MAGNLIRNGHGQMCELVLEGRSVSMVNDPPLNTDAILFGSEEDKIALSTLSSVQGVSPYLHRVLCM